MRPRERADALLPFVVSRGISKRRACQLLALARATAGYKPKLPEKNASLDAEVHQLAMKYPRFGHRMIRAKLQGHTASVGKVWRSWVRQGLQLSNKAKYKRIQGAEHRGLSAICPNGIWAYDFTFGKCSSTKKLKCLTIIDEWTRESLAIHVGSSIKSENVIEVLKRLIKERGPPSYIRSDNGPEFISSAVGTWLTKQGVQTTFIEKGKPWQNGVNESFNKTFKRECLEYEHLPSRMAARTIIERWRRFYNEERPHSSHGYLTPNQKRMNWTKENRSYIKEKQAA